MKNLKLTAQSPPIENQSKKVNNGNDTKEKELKLIYR